MADIDSLDIQMQVSAKKASDSIGILIDKLDKLSNSLGTIETSGLSNFSNAVSGITKSIVDFKNSGIKDKDFTKIADGIRKITEIDSGKLIAIANGLYDLSIGINQIGTISSSVDALSNVALSISKFGGKMATLATANLPKIQSDITTFIQNLNSIGSVTFDAASLSNLALAINKLGGKTATQATANLPKISNDLQIFIQSLNGLQTINFDTTAFLDLANAIAKLGGKNIAIAITNIPQLTNAIYGMMDVLARAPNVSSNIIQMTQALANLASQGAKVGTSSNSLIRGLDRFYTSSQRARKGALSLAAAFGKFYASYFLIVRGIKKLWTAIESSMDVIETINYLDNAFGQVASAAVNNWEQAGYDSAEAYYDSFTKRAQELTAKMSGYTISETGTLAATGATSLGLDPNVLLNYQSVFAQMSSSMGVTSETALLLSQALTEIGADLASVKNLSFEKVWGDMASGLVGMSRTLDKYGVNIRNVNLQQKLTELGIEANVQALNQNDKALLRAIILLDSTKYAWADLSETLDQPANQLRMLQNNFNNLSRTIGNIFLPMVSNILPYINALVIALQRLAQWIADLVGFGEIDWGGTGGGDNDYLSDIYDQADELASGLDEATKNAKKLKQQLQGFDELNVLTSATDTGVADVSSALPSGLLDEAFLNSFSEYQKVWDQAFADLENKAQKLADNIEKAFEPVKKIISDIAIGDWFAVGQDVTSLVTGIEDFFSEAIDKVDWEQIGRNIGEFLDGIDWREILKSTGKLIWEGLKAGVELWSGAFDAAPIETGIITAIALLKWTGLGSALTTSISSITIGETTFGALASKVSVALGGSIVAAVVGFNIGQKLYEVITGEVNSMSWEEQFSTIFKSFQDGTWVDALNLWGEDIDAALNQISTDIGTTVGKAIVKISEKIKGFLSNLKQKATDSFANFGELIDKAFSKITSILSEYGGAMLGNIKEIFNDIKGVGKGLLTFFTGVFSGDWKKAWQGIVDTFGNIFETIYDVAKVPINLVIGLINSMLSAIESGLNFMANAINKVKIDIPDWVPQIGGQTYGFVIPTFSLGRIEYLAEGGYPSKASLFFAGENGIPEMLGTVGGKTAVASGAEITGISDTIRETSSEEVQLLRQQNQLLMQILQKDTGLSDNELFNRVRKANDRYKGNTGVSAFG